MAVEMEVPDDGDRAAFCSQLVANIRNCFRRGLIIYRHPDQFGSSSGQFVNLLNRRGDVGSIGIGHGLDHDRGTTADLNITHFNADRFLAINHDKNLNKERHFAANFSAKGRLTGYL